MSPPICISDAKAPFREQPVYATAFSTMEKLKDCAFGGATCGASAPRALQLPLSLVVKSFAAAGGLVIRDPPNRAESAAIWFCGSTTTAKDGASDDADVPGDTDA